jgi:hypothetical protein
LTTPHADASSGKIFLRCALLLRIYGLLIILSNGYARRKTQNTQVVASIEGVDFSLVCEADAIYLAMLRKASPDQPLNTLAHWLLCLLAMAMRVTVERWLRRHQREDEIL